MEETVIGRIRDARAPLTARQLSEEMECPLEAVETALEALAAEGRVARTRKGGWAVPESIGLVAAKVSFQRNGTPLAQPVSGGAPMPMDSEGDERCMPGDLALVRPDGERCRLNAILRRGRDRFAAYLRVERRLVRGEKGRRPQECVTASAVPCDVRIPYDVALTGDVSALPNDAIALMKIEKYPRAGHPIYASVERVLGDGGSLAALMRAVAEDHGFSTEPAPNVLVEADGFPAEIGPDDLAGREDMRGELIFTIDGSTAKDFDDAVSVGRTGSGWRLGVHIADVSHYVRPGSAVDADAFARGTSLYLPGLTVPMLPERLSNELCSLMPDEDRLALSVVMEIEGGAVVDHRLFRSVIHSHARLTYQQVNRLFDGGETDIPKDVQDALKEMLTLSRALRARRHRRGAIDLELDEPEFVLDADGAPTDILLSPRGEAERIIEDFMLAANETVAALAKNASLPFVYRVHEAPDPARLRALEAFMDGLGVSARIGPRPHPGMLQGVLESLRDHPASDIIRRATLRALKKARYDESPLGHYALSMEDYCHFTSPIRRYPDLTVHRMLKRLIDAPDEHDGALAARMGAIARDCSQRESAAVAAERQADGIMTAAWMSAHLGELFDGVVSNITAWGLYVALANGAEGLVHISTLDDYYEYDADRSRLVGAANGAVIRIGDRVRVRADRVNVEQGEIDFGLAPAEEKASEGET